MKIKNEINKSLININLPEIIQPDVQLDSNNILKVLI